VAGAQARAPREKQRSAPRRRASTEPGWLVLAEQYPVSAAELWAAVKRVVPRWRELFMLPDAD
jgi:hypothetical protein